MEIGERKLKAEIERLRKQMRITSKEIYCRTKKRKATTKREGTIEFT